MWRYSRRSAAGGFNANRSDADGRIVRLRAIPRLRLSALGRARFLRGIHGAALLGGSHNLRIQVIGRIDEADVGKRLREIAELTPLNGVVFLGQEPQVVADREQAFVELPCVIVPSHEVQAVRQPEGAGQEGSLAGRKPVDGARG